MEEKIANNSDKRKLLIYGNAWKDKGREAAFKRDRQKKRKKDLITTEDTKR